VINILLALRSRDRTGIGCKLDIAMADNLFTLMYWGIGNGAAAGQWPQPGGELVTGGSPRYNIYRTRDDRFLAAAPLEQKFWDVFCEGLALPQPLRDDARDPAATRAAVAERVRARSAAELQALFEGQDVCCTIAVSLEDALNDPRFAERRLFSRTLTNASKSMTALPVPVAENFRAEEQDAGYPKLGEANELLGK
jgi:crotonobetainyl-CoA:carnitine CoA-transferase CaiB-like acyl-CoA transferase